MSPRTDETKRRPARRKSGRRSTPAARDRALVLRRRPYGESSLIVQLAAGVHGRVHLLAKGAFRPKSGYCGVLDLFDTLRVEFRAAPGGGMGNLASAEIATRRRAMTSALWRYRAGLFLLELYELACHPAHGEHAPFDLLERALDALVATDDPRTARPIATGFALRLLALLGLEPALERCAACGGPAPPVSPDGRRAAFSASAGGRLCLDCARSARASGRRVGTLPVAVLAGAERWLTKIAPDTAPRVEPPHAAGEDRTDRGLVDFVQRFLEYHLEFRPRVRLEDL